MPRSKNQYPHLKDTAQWIGRIPIKSYWQRTVAPSGAEAAVFMKAIPPYCIPRQYTLRVNIVGASAADLLAPTKGGFYHMRGALVDVDPTTIQASETPDVILGRHFSPYGSETFFPDDAVESEVGIPGDQEDALSPYMKARTFFSRTEWLGLPGNAVFRDADQMFVVDSFKTSGYIKTSRPAESPGFLGFGFSMDESATQVNNNIAIWGNEGDFGSLHEELLSQFTPFSQEGEVSEDQARLSPNALSWIQEGINTVGIDGLPTAGVVVRVFLSVAVDVYAPIAGMKYVAMS